MAENERVAPQDFDIEETLAVADESASGPSGKYMGAAEGIAFLGCDDVTFYVYGRYELSMAGGKCAEGESKEQYGVYEIPDAFTV
jgi:hypothetical protein